MDRETEKEMQQSKELLEVLLKDHQIDFGTHSKYITLAETEQLMRVVKTGDNEAVMRLCREIVFKTLNKIFGEKGTLHTLETKIKDVHSDLLSNIRLIHTIKKNQIQHEKDGFLTVFGYSSSEIQKNPRSILLTDLYLVKKINRYLLNGDFKTPLTLLFNNKNKFMFPGYITIEDFDYNTDTKKYSNVHIKIELDHEMKKFTPIYLDSDRILVPKNKDLYLHTGEVVIQLVAGEAEFTQVESDKLINLFHFDKSMLNSLSNALNIVNILHCGEREKLRLTAETILAEPDMYETTTILKTATGSSYRNVNLILQKIGDHITFSFSIPIDSEVKGKDEMIEYMFKSEKNLF